MDAGSHGKRLPRQTDVSHRRARGAARRRAGAQDSLRKIESSAPASEEHFQPFVCFLRVSALKEARRPERLVAIELPAAGTRKVLRTLSSTVPKRQNTRHAAFRLPARPLAVGASAHRQRRLSRLQPRPPRRDDDRVEVGRLASRAIRLHRSQSRHAHRHSIPTSRTGSRVHRVASRYRRRNVRRPDQPPRGRRRLAATCGRHRVRRSTRAQPGTFQRSSSYSPYEVVRLAQYLLAPADHTANIGQAVGRPCSMSLKELTVPTAHGKESVRLVSVGATNRRDAAISSGSTPQRSLRDGSRLVHDGEAGRRARRCRRFARPKPSSATRRPRHSISVCSSRRTASLAIKNGDLFDSETRQ